MRRWLVVSILLIAVASTAASAQEQQQSYPPQSGGYGQGGTQSGGGMTQGGGGMMGGGMGRGMMHGPGGGPCLGGIVACASMVMPQLTATSDGGVVIAVGGKLVKYDAALRKVAETNINIDWTQVQQRIEQMIQNCPMHRGMMQMPQQRGRAPGQYQGPPQPQFRRQPQGQFQGQPQSQFQGQQ